MSPSTRPRPPARDSWRRRASPGRKRPDRRRARGGRGDQCWSWTSWGDRVRVIRHVLESSLPGPVNAVSPNPTTHRLFIKALGRALHRPAVLAIPKLVLKETLGTELAEALVLGGQKGV